MSTWPNLLAHRSEYDLIMDETVDSGDFFDELCRRKREPAPVIAGPARCIFHYAMDVREGFVNIYRDGSYGALHSTRSDAIAHAALPAYRIHIIPKERRA